jgi:hypothetical protein
MRGLLVFALATLALLACGDSATSVEDIPADKKVVDLNASEEQSLCAWSSQVASEKLAAAPAKGRCGNAQFSVMGCMMLQADCDATVAQFKACIPNFIGRIADDPCVVFSLTSQVEVSSFIEETPGCAGLGPCGFVMK